ncbi:MAG: protein kinase [Micavibrio sp.]|nr:protein kinase [Micavibrio sp.]|tara:strand:- start:533 stop:2098 length:1566 start_codon:yes stop_codon:yes gene_type:complete
MFGKKQNTSSKPVKKDASKKAPEQEAVDVSDLDIEANKETEATEGKESKTPSIDHKLEDEKETKKPAKKIKSLDDDILEVSMVESDENREENNEDSLTSMRLKRAKKRIWSDLRDGIDLKALARMDQKAAREEVSSAVEEIARFRNLDLTPAELLQIAKESADDMLGYGPLESLLERDGIADIMINGPDTVYIEEHGKITKANISFRDNQHLTTICQRIVGAIGRRVDEASPICDARLPDGSRVNVIIPPLAVDGSCMTIRKFTKDKLTLDKLMEFGSLTPSCAKLIMAIGRCRVNVLVSGGTGSGKTTMLNCLTRYIEQGERVITCEDACELQLQQPHVVRLETRPPNLEGVGEVTMRDLVKNCLRMRPERIIVGEVRGPEAFDLLQAMNTGHDGSMGTVHANNPREALSRMENMIAMGNLNIPTAAVREQIAAAVNVIIQVQRLRDGSRKVTHVSEITGMEGEVITMQDLFTLDILGEDEDGKLITEQKSTGLRPKFFDNARTYGVDQLVLDAMEEAYG